MYYDQAHVPWDRNFTGRPHHRLPVRGFRFGNIAYITDMSTLPEHELLKLQGLEHVTLNTVSYHPHHSHFSLEEALRLAYDGLTLEDA